ncbi:MAG: sensor histidine kinase [Acidimicrobiia bacterium]
MNLITNRAPIDYDDLRGPYNVVRAVGSAVFVVGMAIWATITGHTDAYLLLIPGFAVLIDAIYRRTVRESTAMPGIIIDTTAIGIALMLHGPNPGLHGLAIISIIVSAGLLLKPTHALIVVGYSIAISFGVLLGDRAGLSWVSVMGAEEDHLVVDTVIAGIFIGATSWILFLAVRVILAAQDRQAEALAVERRAVQLKNEFVSMVSHELRTPLTGIAGFTDTLAESWTTLPSPEVDEFLSIMGRETDHLANLVEDILVIPRLEAGQLRLDPTDIDLALEAHAVANVLFTEGDYSVAIARGVIVRADRTRLRQIMRNLMENAEKYGGDQVLIEGELSTPGLYTVSVSDNGHGVAPEDQTRIFEHFEQLSTGDGRLQQGVGLGLPIARKLATAMGGDLWYEDRFPVGAKFCFTVPISRMQSPTDVTPLPHVATR